MAEALKNARQRALRVYLSSEKVPASKMDSVVPKGYRKATFEEVAEWYRRSPEFREELWKKGWARAAQKGLASEGRKKIEEGGRFSDVDKETFDSLPEGSKSFHCPGENELAFVVDAYVRKGGLLADAEFNPKVPAFVAYVKDGRKGALEGARRG